jgi:hypothetical protein
VGFGPGAAVEAAEATLREAALLGVTGYGALSPIGSALLAGAGLLDAIGDIGSTQHTARLQADLTAVVTGEPSAALAELLDLAGDCEVRATASIWRFTPASVRRAFDAGLSQSDLLDRLKAVAQSGLPQALEYLISDVARRFGAVRVTGTGSCLVSDDAILLQEIAADRRLRALGLRLLAPTVLASAKPLAETTRALRDAGYAPAAVGADGQPVVERKSAARVSGDSPRPGERESREGPDLEALALRLLAAKDSATGPRTPTFGRVRDGGANLSEAELTILAHAIDHRRPVTIGYVNQDGNGSVRTIDPVQLSGTSLYAWCHLRGDHRYFNLTRIGSVEPAELG